MVLRFPCSRILIYRICLQMMCPFCLKWVFYSLPFLVYIYIYVYTYVHIYISLYIYIYLYFYLSEETSWEQVLEVPTHVVRNPAPFHHVFSGNHLRWPYVCLKFRISWGTTPGTTTTSVEWIHILVYISNIWGIPDMYQIGMHVDYSSKNRFPVYTHQDPTHTHIRTTSERPPK